jgi:diphthine synthase
MTLSLISIGLADEQDLSQRAIQEARACDTLYAELYTTILDTDLERLGALIGKPVKPLTRSQLEEGSEGLLEEARRRKVGVLVGGDCLTATTHVGLLLEAAKKGIPTKVVHGSSILTAVTETGLSLYKFGRTVTLPLPERAPPDTVLRTLRENREHGLHTLVLLDIDAEEGRHKTIPQALKTLLRAEDPESFNPGTLTVAAARLGWKDQTVRAGKASEIAALDLGPPPHVIIVPGDLHFLEAEALKTLAGCPEEDIEDHKPTGDTDKLIRKYSEGCRRVMEELEKAGPPRRKSADGVKALIEHAARYVDDAEYYAQERKATALASVSYAEGILDALKLLGLVEFEW